MVNHLIRSYWSYIVLIRSSYIIMINDIELGIVVHPFTLLLHSGIVVLEIL